MELSVVHAETNWPMYYIKSMLEQAAEKRMKPGEAMLFINASGLRIKLVLWDGMVLDKRKEKGEEPWDVEQIRALFKRNLSLTITVTKAKDQKAIDSAGVRYEEAA